jgi:hypothetical protein
MLKISSDQIKIKSIRDENATKIKEQQALIDMIRDAVLKGNSAQEQSIDAMRELLANEIKDMRAANTLFSLELERSQTIFRNL